jgi:hypothetical protein
MLLERYFPSTTVSSWTGPSKPRLIYEPLTFVLSGNLVASQNGTTSVSVFKMSGSNSWDNHAYVDTSFTAPCTLEFNKWSANNDNGRSYAMIGWNTDPTTNTSFNSLDYASYPYRMDTYSVYHNGSQVLFSGAWSRTNKFYIVYGTDGFLRHYNGSTQLYSVNIGNSTTTYYIDSSFYSPFATFGGFSNIRAIRRAWNGTSYI